jgi:hypothetical protein
MSKQAETQGRILRRKVTTKINVMHSDMQKKLGVLSFVGAKRVLVGNLK